MAATGWDGGRAQPFSTGAGAAGGAMAHWFVCAGAATSSLPAGAGAAFLWNMESARARNTYTSMSKQTHPASKSPMKSIRRSVASAEIFGAELPFPSSSFLFASDSSDALIASRRYASSCLNCA